MIGQIYLGTIAASAGMAAAGEIITNYKFKKDGYIPEKIRTKEAKIIGTTAVATLLAVPGINLLFGGFNLVYNVKYYDHMKSCMLENGFLHPIDKKEKKLKLGE